MDALTAAFDVLCCLRRLSLVHDLFASGARYYKENRETYTYAATAYSHAAWCQDNRLARRTSISHRRLESRFGPDGAEDKAARENAANGATNIAPKAADFRAKAAEDATKAELLGQKAEDAESKAEVFLAKAKVGRGGKSRGTSHRQETEDALKQVR